MWGQVLPARGAEASVVPDALLDAGQADEVLTGQEARVLQLGQAHGAEPSVPGATDRIRSRYSVLISDPAVLLGHSRTAFQLVACFVQEIFYRRETHVLELSEGYIHKGISTVANLHIIHLKPLQTLFLRTSVSGRRV